MNCFVVTVVEIGSIRATFPFTLGWNTGVLVNLGQDLVDLNEGLGFLSCLSRPGAGHNVIRLLLLQFGAQVEGHRTELSCATTLQKDNLVVGWNAHEFSEVSLCSFHNSSKFWGTMTKLHDTGTTAMVIQHLFLSNLEHLKWQSGRAGGEVELAVSCHFSLFPKVRRCGSG
uniref:Uncharacterized protein n=1 Tax=Ixodes ricinus TaxID=34613 RepID=A0A147BUF3_IXORI